MLVLLKQYIYGSIIQMAMNGSNFLEELYRTDDCFMSSEDCCYNDQNIQIK